MQKPDAPVQNGTGVERHIIDLVQQNPPGRQIAVAAHLDIPADDPPDGAECLDDIGKQIFVQYDQTVRHLRDSRHVEQPDDPFGPDGAARSVRHTMHPFPAGHQAGGGQQLLDLRHGDRIMFRPHDDRQLSNTSLLQFLYRHCRHHRKVMTQRNRPDQMTVKRFVHHHREAVKRFQEFRRQRTRHDHPGQQGIAKIREQPAVFMGNLCKDGEALYDIVIPSEAGAAVVNAAEELTDYVYKVSGARLDLKYDSGESGSNFISLGDTAELKKAGFEVDYDSLGSDGFVMKTLDKLLKRD